MIVVFLVDDDLLGAAEVLDLDVLEADAEVLGDALAVGQDGQVLEHRLAAIAEAGGLDRGCVERAAQLVDDERGQRLALDVFRDDDQGLPGLRGLLEHGEQVLHRRDLLLVDEDVGVFKDDFHPLGVGDEVRREVAAIELHALDDFERRLEATRLFNRDDAVLADLLHRLGDDLADRRVVVGGDGADLRDRLADDRAGQLLDLPRGVFHGLLDAALDVHGVRAGGDGLHALAEDRLGEDGRGGRAVAGDVRGFRCDLAHELRAHVFASIFELDFLGDRHAVLGGQRRSELLLQDHIAALGAEGDLDGIGKLVDSTEHRLTRVLGVGDVLRRHFSQSSKIGDV